MSNDCQIEAKIFELMSSSNRPISFKKLLEGNSGQEYLESLVSALFNLAYSKKIDLLFRKPRSYHQSYLGSITSVNDEVFKTILSRQRNELCALPHDLELAHYTSFSNMQKIIKHSSFKLSQMDSMNDGQEIVFGRNILKRVLDSARLERFFDNHHEYKDLLISSFGRLMINLESKDEKGTQKKLSSFSFTKHSSQDAKKNGILSMWVHYAPPNNSGVAMVFKSDQLLSEYNPYGYDAYPVLYPDEYDISEIEAELCETFCQLFSNGLVNRPLIMGYLYEALLIYCATIKHPGFSEENEIRLVTKTESDVSMAYGLKCFGNANYIEFPTIESSNSICIRNELIKVIISPGNDEVERGLKVKKFLDAQALNVEVLISEIPYRQKKRKCLM